MLLARRNILIIDNVRFRGPLFDDCDRRRSQIEQHKAELQAHRGDVSGVYGRLGEGSRVSVVLEEAQRVLTAFV